MNPERDEHGTPVFAPVAVGRPPMGEYELHVYTCSLLGIRDPALVRRAWAEELAKAAPKEAD